MNWTDEDINKMQAGYSQGLRTTECPVCGGKVTITKEEGEAHLKKKYVDSHFFLVFICEGCGLRDTRTHKKTSY